MTARPSRDPGQPYQKEVVRRLGLSGDKLRMSGTVVVFDIESAQNKRPSFQKQVQKGREHMAYGKKQKKNTTLMWNVAT